MFAVMMTWLYVLHDFYPKYNQYGVIQSLRRLSFERCSYSILLLDSYEKQTLTKVGGIGQWQPVLIPSNKILWENR